MLAACLASACAGGAPQVRATRGPIGPHALYPLGAGQAWSYDVDTGDGASVLAVTRVVNLAGDTFEVQSGGGELLRYARRDDGWFRPARGSYLLRGPVAVGTEWESGPGVVARIAAVEQTVETPAGRFARCVVVQERGAPSGQQVDTTYCPEVGPAIVESRMRVRGQVVRVTARLRGFTTLQ